VGIGKKEGCQEDHGFEPAANVDFCDYGKKQNCQSLTFSVSLSGQIGPPDEGILSFIDRRVERERWPIGYIENNNQLIELIFSKSQASYL
jgi:hypothetical protein